MTPLPLQLPTEQLHRVFLDALDGHAMEHTPIDDKPLDVDLAPPLPSRIRAYIYNATHPPGGRTMGEHKVQLIVPGQQRGERGNFDYSGGRIVLLFGYEPELEVFVLWDAGVYRDFSFSRNVQVKAKTIYKAYALGIGLQHRRLRSDREVVIAAHRTRLPDALSLRTRHSLDRLLGVRHA